MNVGILLSYTDITMESASECLGKAILVMHPVPEYEEINLYASATYLQSRGAIMSVMLGEDNETIDDKSRVTVELAAKTFDVIRSVRASRRHRFMFSRWNLGADTLELEASSGVMAALGLVLHAFWTDPDPEVGMMEAANDVLRGAIWVIHQGFSDVEFSAIKMFASVTYFQTLNTVRSVSYFGSSVHHLDREHVADMCYATAFVAMRTMAFITCVKSDNSISV